MTQSGWRKPTPGLLQAERFAEVGEHKAIPKSQAIVAVKKVAAAIGLKSQDLLLLDTFGAVTQVQDWEQGRRPIVWASNNFLMEQTGFSLATLRRHVRRLCEAGVISMKDSPNGERWGRRDANGVIVEAYGFDLSPLAARAEEFEGLYAQLQAERAYCASLRNAITVTRRVIRAKIEKALESGLGGPWMDLQEEFAHLLQSLPRRSMGSEKLITVLDWFRRLRDRVDQALEAAFEWSMTSDVEKADKPDTVPDVAQIHSNTIPRSLINETHIRTTNEPEPVTRNRFETKHADSAAPSLPPPDDLEMGEDVNLDIDWSTDAKKSRSNVDIPMLLAACPHFAEMACGVQGYMKDWNDVHRAASALRPMAEISENAWHVANQVLGPAVAAASIALIFDKHTEGEVTSPGGYLRGMVEKAGAGELHLERSIHGRLGAMRRMSSVPRHLT